MALQAPRVDLHAKMLEDVNAAIDRLTLRSRPANAPRRVTFATILAGHDGSPRGRRAVDWAGAMAGMHDARVVVASVAPTPPPPADAGNALGTYWPRMLAEYARMDRELRESAESCSALLRMRGVSARGVVAVGSPAVELTRLSREHDADLVVLGGQGGTRLDRALGSVAGSLAGRLDASILVARTAPPPERILVATDGSPESDRAVTLALEMATAKKAELVVQHVLEFPGDASAIPPEGYLHGIVDRMMLPTPPRVRYVLDVGGPAERIMARAEQERAGLVVLGARGLGRVKGALLGSVSQRVAAASPTSVLVVRGAAPL